MSWLRGVFGAIGGRDASRRKDDADRRSAAAGPAHASEALEAAPGSPVRSDPGRSFTVIDIETANPRYHSICQIGLVRFEDGREVAARSFLVDPVDEFAPFNVRLHGISAARVRGAPRFPDLLPELQQWVGSCAMVSHGKFDRSALRLACERWQLAVPAPLAWVDSIDVAIAAFPDVAAKGCRLNELATALGLEFRHHDALEDARTAGLIVVKALDATGLALDELTRRARAVEAPRRAGRNVRARVERTGDGDGGLLGETVVFTGELSISREEAANMAAEAGADVRDSVTYATTMLVIGERDLQPGWPAKSAKQRKAEELIDKGVQIRLVSETDFLRLAAIKD